jgi:CBS domain-containing protein
VLRQIRTRILHAADGSATDERSVRCRWRARAASVDECVRCPARIGMRIDPRGGDSWVACRRAAIDDDDDRDTIGAVLARVVHCVRADVELERVRQLLAEGDLEAVAVIGADGALVGVATARDPVARPAIAIREDEPIARAAAIITHERVDYLALVSGAGVVLGVVTPRDFLRWIAREDGYIV